MKLLDESRRRAAHSIFHHPPDHYTVLGVSSSASNKKITQAYRQLAKNLHPGACTTCYWNNLCEVSHECIYLLQMN